MTNQTFAHYFASKSRRVVYITPTPSLVGVDLDAACIQVSGKVEARRIAAERGAKCWNF